MGQTLSSPDTEKHKKSGGDERFSYGLCEMQGWRISMEDAHAIELQLENGKNSVNNTFFAVYDGHGGGSVAKFSGENVHKRLINEDEYHNQRWESALKRAFLGTDEDIRADSRFFRDPAGCTAVAALITHDKRIFVANAGDSRSVMSIKGEVKPLSFDHKPLNETEMTRIRNAGGYVEYGRVNGNLALSRAIGDFEFKKNHALSAEEQIITANPDVIEHQITEEDEFLILACDGIWDCLTSQQVIDIVRLQISERKELDEIAEFICDLCLAPDTTSGAGVGCDNMTILIVAILNGRTKEQWYDWVADRVKQGYGYQTPTAIPQIYAPNRVTAFRARRQAYEERLSRDHNGEESPLSANLNDYGGVFGGRGIGPSPGALGFARAIFGGGGISFHPGASILNDDSNLHFANEDSDEDSDDDVEMGSGRAGNDAAQSFFASLGLRPPPQGGGDVTRILKEQLDELEEEADHANSRFEEVGEDDDDGDGESEEDKDSDDSPTSSNPGDEARQVFGASSKARSESPVEVNGVTTSGPSEAPPPPAPRINGDIRVKQFSPHPQGDQADPVVKAEGLMDASEEPLKV